MIPQTEEAGRAYRELILTTPGLGKFINGVIYDETIRQSRKDGSLFVKAITNAGIILGIKVDSGAKDMAGHPGEKMTEGLDGLRDHLVEYAQMGARFAKWRAVIAVGDGLPSQGCIEANAHALARYAALCQEAEMVAYYINHLALSECCALVVLGGALFFLGIVLYVPFLRDLFHSSKLHLIDLIISLVDGCISILWFEGFKIMNSRQIKMA